MKTETSKLLREAIADAKAVRQTALENAKAVLAEAFTPKLQSMLSKKLQQEVEDIDMDNEVCDIEEFNSLADSGLATQHGDHVHPKDVPVTTMETKVPADSNYTDPSVHADDGSEIALSDTDVNMTPDNDTVSLQKQNSKLTPSNTDHSSQKGSGSEIGLSDHDTDLTLDIGDDDLNEIIAELEMDLEDDVDDMPVDEVPPSDEPVMDVPPTDECPSDVVPMDNGEEPAGDVPVDDVTDMDDDEEIDIEEILREMEIADDHSEECDMPSHDAMNEAKAQIKALKEENAEYEKAFTYLRSKLNEVNLLNAKLLYTNKIFKKYGLNNNQKMKIVEAFDRTSTVREVKITFSNLCESFNIVNNGKSKTSISEGIASKPIKGTKPSAKKVEESKAILNEGHEYAERFKKLANIIK